MSTDVAALCESSAWLNAPFDMLFTAVDTSCDDADTCCAVAVSSWAVAAVSWACEDMFSTIVVRFSITPSIEMIRLAISSFPLAYFLACSFSSDTFKS